MLKILCTVIFFLSISLSILLPACSGNNNPAGPPFPEENSLTKPVQLVQIPGTNRHILGLWKFYIPENHQTAEVVPVRTSDFHLNLTTFLEISPCTTCVQVREVLPKGPGELLVYVRLRNPFDNPKLTGFDVRGIFIGGSDKNFPVTGRNISWDGTNPRLLNADGYTDIFNPTEYPEDSPLAKIYKYVTGKQASGGDLSATLNPFMSYSTLVQGDRVMFVQNSQGDAWFHLKIPPGPISFGYAIDASYEITDDDVIDPYWDMPEGADMREARRIDVVTGGNLGLGAGSTTFVQAKIFDKQGIGTINSVIAEAPDLFSGTVNLSYEGQFEDSHNFIGTITNSLGAAEGTYPLLVKVTDSEVDPILGENSAWKVASIKVSDNFVRHWGIADASEVNYYMVDSVVDDSGNTICFGPYDGGMDLSPDDTVDNFNQSEPSHYLVKFDSTGKYSWAVRWPVADYVAAISHIKLTTDSEGNVYAAGVIKDVGDFDPGPGEDPQGLTGVQSAFVSKFTADGTYLWTSSWNDAQIWDVLVLENGNVMVSGYLQGVVDIDPGPEQVLVDPAVNGGGYITHLTPTGEFIDVVTLWVDPVCIIKNNQGKIFIGGLFGGTRDFDPDPFVKYELTAGNPWDFYIASYNADMIFLWARQWGNYETPQSYQSSVVTDLRADPAGDVYMTGLWYGTVDFDPTVYWDLRTAHSYNYFPNNEMFDPFIVKYSSGGDYLWAYTEGSDRYDTSERIDFDSAGNILVSGLWNLHYYSTAKTPMGYQAVDSHLLQLDPDGNVVWESIWGQDSWLRNAQYGPSDDIYIQGIFQNWADADPGDETVVMNAIQNYDIYIERLNPDGSF